jgi:hypothetical protein
MLMDAAHEVVCKAEIECPVPTAGKETDIIRQLSLRGSFRDGPHGPGPDGVAPSLFLLPDAKIAEDHVEQILDVDSAGDPPEAAQCQAEIFGVQLGKGRSGASA